VTSDSGNTWEYLRYIGRAPDPFASEIGGKGPNGNFSQPDRALADVSFTDMYAFASLSGGHVSEDRSAFVFPR
jgi:hypothetical protein